MSAIDSLTSTVIALECCNISLFALLLVTPAPKHSMVKTLIASCLFRSVLDILPPSVHKAARMELDGAVSNNGMISFCIADSILLRYVTVVKAAFAVSFTLPCLYLAIVQLQPKRSADDYPRLTRHTVLTLCGAPFVWALPVLITPLVPIIRRQGQGQPTTVAFNINSCYFDDPAFTVVSLIFTLIPLAIAVLITLIMGIVIWRFSHTMLDHTGWLFVKTKRFARFAALVFVTMISAALYTVVLSLWMVAHKAWMSPQDPVGSDLWRDQHPMLTRMVRTSALWEAITPLLFFIIFAAQEEIYETWRGWLSLIITLPGRKHDGRLADGLRTSQLATQDMQSSRTNQLRSFARDRSDLTLPTFKQPTLPGKIATRPLSSPRRVSYSEGRRGPTSGQGLNPPPRRGRQKSVSTDEQSRSSPRYRLPFMKAPSMTTFGSQFSAGSRSHRYTSSYGDFTTESGGPSSTVEVPFTEWPSRNSYHRPETPGSSRTFGRGGAAKR
ncbi:hypothetical protein L226DRAFT_565081 [Lentinus tigrinus ALCF2SS1-7]|uniref:STE3-domain-containing protein n=1 Tax=Lentinus tigrinus ALCF2SS1-6 TaxID=1328759 RepID=A0A5C2SGH5_9APHY|nr:hypothetical protein L227DRAFT_599207 [Lentinus tigrinus ALCF2SS1-6]RPD82517.1 hypothetical protein L226DRAFT_565081 [Lentinus tigrinus ALCF2SS1-7]